MDDVAIQVNEVSKSFRLPHERHSGLKQAVINFRPGRHFETQQVLRGITFDIKKGDFYGIVGRNGSGKSTLLKLLAQIYVPDRGSIAVNGSLTPFIELGVGFNPELTGRENIFLNGALLGFDRKQVASMYNDIVSFAELERFMDQKLKNYSSGMQVRLAFSIAIRAKSDILLLDEVLAVGDSGFQQKCFDYFEELKAEQKTVVFVTHDMAAMRRFCNKAIYLKNGEIIHRGDPIDIADYYAMENIDTEIIGDEEAPTDYRTMLEIVEQAQDTVKIRVSYESKDDQPNYVGLSLIKDGMSVAELTTPHNRPLVGGGSVTYDLKTNLLNAGVYQVSAVLCRLKGRRLLAAGTNRVQFVVKGEDLTRGGALKLPDSWQYG